MPKWFLTEDGPRPEFAELYGAKEHTSRRYEDRTLLNLQDADTTILIGNADSPGSRLAYRCFRRIKGEQGRDPGILYIRPGWIVVTRMPASGMLNCSPPEVAEMLAKMDHRIVNVAGNRESSAPGIGVWVERYMAEVFRLVKAGPST